MSLRLVRYGIYLTLGAHAPEGYSTYFVCVCVSVCPRSANAIKRLYSILNLPMGFLLSVEDFQLTDLSKRPSFRRYSLFRSF